MKLQRWANKSKMGSKMHGSSVNFNDINIKGKDLSQVLLLWGDLTMTPMVTWTIIFKEQ